MDNQNSKLSKLSFLKKVDAFGVSISFRFQEAAKHKTQFGGLITVLIMSISILLVLQIFQQIIYKKNPNVVYDQRIVTQPSRFDLKLNNFSFVMAIMDAYYTPFIDEKVYKINARIRFRVPKFNAKTNKIEYVNEDRAIPLGRCKPENFQVQGTEEYFLKLDYTNMYCIQEYDDLHLVGQFENDEFTLLEFKIIKCGQDLTSQDEINANCLPEDELNKILPQLTLQTYYTNQVVQVNNKENPFLPIGQTYFWEGNVNYLQNISLLYINTYVEDDDGLFFQEINSKRQLIMNSERTMFSSKSNEGMFKISLYLEKNKEFHYQRSYLKIQQAISQIGGLYNIFFLLGCIIVFPYSQMQLNRQLFNSTFSISKNRNLKEQNIINNSGGDSLNSSPGQKTYENNQSSKKQTAQLDSSVNQPNIKTQLSQVKQKVSTLDVFKVDKIEESCENGQSNNQIQSEEGFLKKIQKKFNNIQVGTVEYFSYYFGCMQMLKSESNEILKFGMDKISSYTDICFIINKLLEIEKLKHLLLNDEQIKLFEFIPKPKIDSNIIQEYKDYQQIEKTMLRNQFDQSDLQRSQREKKESGFSQTTKSNKIRRLISPSHIRHNEVNILSIQARPLFEKALQAKQAYNNIYKHSLKKNKIDLKLIQMLDQELIGMLNLQENVNESYNKSPQYTQQFILNSTQKPEGMNANDDNLSEKQLMNFRGGDIEFATITANEEITLQENSSPMMNKYQARKFNFLKKVRHSNDQNNSVSLEITQ